jgi:hypothetical protein
MIYQRYHYLLTFFYRAFFLLLSEEKSQYDKLGYLKKEKHKRAMAGI